MPSAPVLCNVSALLFVWQAVGVRIRGGAVLEVTRLRRARVCVFVCACVCVCVCVCCVRAGSWPDSLSCLCVKERVFLVCPEAGCPEAFCAL